MPIGLRLRYTQWLAGGLVSCGIFAHCCPSQANSVPLEVETTSIDLDPTAAPMNQVTSVTQLADVKPTEWAFQALRSLSERYGVISGYPDSTFRGNRSLTRYEFAGALEQVLEQINTLITNGAGSQINPEDLTTLRRLQREYGLALSDLRTRLDRIGNRSTQLEAEQFSTTTKLQGQVILAFTDGRNANPTVVSRQRLNLLTSFTRGDLLLTQLESGNAGADAIAKVHNEKQNLLGTTGIFANGGGLDYAEVPTPLRLRRLYYTFRPDSNVAVTIGARMPPRDFIDRNRYANNEAVDFSSSFFINNPLIVQNQIDRDGGAGAAIAWNIGGSSLTVRSLYIAADANQVSPTTRNQGGLFEDRYQGSVELEYSPSEKVAVRLQYTNALINNTDIEAAGINAEYAFNRNTAVFGRFGFGSYKGFNTAEAQQLDLHPRTWELGLALHNFAIPGTLAGVAIGQPFVTGDLGNATQTNFEAFYNLTLSDNISITPALQLVSNANNDSSTGTTWQGTLRTSFEF